MKLNSPQDLLAIRLTDIQFYWKETAKQKQKKNFKNDQKWEKSNEKKKRQNSAKRKTKTKLSNKLKCFLQPKHFILFEKVNKNKQKQTNRENLSKCQFEKILKFHSKRFYSQNYQKQLRTWRIQNYNQ